MNYKSLRILYFDSKEIVRSEILWGLIEMGVTVEGADFCVDLNIPDEQQIVKIWEKCKNYDIVMTQNFSVNVAAACHLAKVRYVSWIYDSPQIALYTDFALFEENYVFCFDKVQVSRLEARGLKNVFYQPLAANVKYINTLPLSASHVAPYKADFSFVGQLYNTTPLNYFFNIATEEETDAFKADVSRYFCNWEEGTNIYAQNNELATQLSKYITQSDFVYYKASPSFTFKTLIHSIYLAREERLALLSDASNLCHASLNTIEKDITLAKSIPKLKVSPPIRNEKLYQTYKGAKMNLNVSLHSIENAAPQRVFDITAVGGVVISDYRPAIAELFEPEKEIILFKSRDEFNDKLKFYLKNTKALHTISTAGLKRTTHEYNYVVALNNIFSKI